MEFFDDGRYSFRKMTTEEALEIAVKTPPSDANASRRNDDRWAGESWDTALQMAITGDEKSARGLQKYLGVLARVRQNNRTIARWGESGSTVDVSRFIAGEPECMIETVRARRPAPVTRIAVERAVSHYVSQEEMRATGASVMAVVEALRTAGVPAEIWVTFSVTSFSATHSTQVLVQEAGRPINVEVLAFWVANPAAFRRIGFAIEEQEDKALRKRIGFTVGAGYGAPTTPKSDDDLFDEVAPANSAAAEIWIAEVLSRRAGVELTRGDYE